MAKSNKHETPPIFGRWEYGRVNYLIFLAGVVDIALAYVIMAAGGLNSFSSLTIAPIMLVIGYVVIIPVAILYRPGNRAS
ncbi:MAG: hypothetical protein V3W14_04765 [Candidatus Neomarinimicrobiota bacterium]